jgi:hypothetical protein
LTELRTEESEDDEEGDPTRKLSGYKSLNANMVPESRPKSRKLFQSMVDKSTEGILSDDESSPSTAGITVSTHVGE